MGIHGKPNRNGKKNNRIDSGKPERGATGQRHLTEGDKLKANRPAPIDRSDHFHLNQGKHVPALDINARDKGGNATVSSFQSSVSALKNYRKRNRAATGQTN